VHRFLVGDAHDKAPESVRSQNESLPFYRCGEGLGPPVDCHREKNLGGGVMRNDPGRDTLDAWKHTGRARGCLHRAASIAGDDRGFLWRDPDFCGGDSAVFAQAARIISSIASLSPS